MIHRAIRLAFMMVVIPLLAACPIYQQDGYLLETRRLVGGEAATLHPAVLEYVFATPTGPMRAYYDAALRARDSAVKDRSLVGAITRAADLASLETDARALAGTRPPTGEHYARARAHRMSSAANQAFSTKQGVTLSCCQSVDRKTGKLLAARLWLALQIHERARAVHVVGNRFEPDYTWDLQYVPNAFAPDQPLAYETVVLRAVPIHRAEDFK